MKTKQNNISRSINKAAARRERKRRQKYSRRNKAARMSTSVKAARRSAVAVKAARRNERRAAVLAAIIAITKKVVVKRSTRMVERPVLKRNKAVVSPAVAARRAAAEGSVAFTSAVEAGVMRALSHNVVDYAEKARATRLAAEQRVAAAVGVPVSSLTKAVVCQLDTTPVDISTDVEALVNKPLPELKADAAALGLTHVVGKRTVLFGYEDCNHARKDTWRTALIEHYKRSLGKVEEKPVVEDVVVEEEVVEVVVEETTSVLSALPVNNPISDGMLAQARRLGLGDLSEELAKAYYVPGKTTRQMNPLNNACIDAVAVLRYGKGFKLPAGFEPGCNIVIPNGFTTRWVMKGEEWVAIPKPLISGIEILNALSKQPGAETCSRNWSKAKKTKVVEECGANLVKLGYHIFAVKVYHKLVAETISYLTTTKTAKVVCTTEVAKVVVDYVKAYNKKLIPSLDRLLVIDAGWLKPSVGADYKRALGFFKVLEQGIQAVKFSNDITCRPLTLLEGSDSFVVWIGEHLSFLFEKNGDVTVRDHMNGNQSVVQPVLYCSKRLYGEFEPGEVVMLNAIDQVLYHFENYHLVDLNRQWQMDNYRQVIVRAGEIAKVFHSSTIQYVKDNYVLQVNGEWTPAHAMTRFRRTAKPVMLAVPSLFGTPRADDHISNKDANLYGATTLVAKTPNYQCLNKDLSERANLVSFVPVADKTSAVPVDPGSVIAEGYRQGVTVRPFGSCDGFAANDLYRVSASKLKPEAQKVFVLKAFENAWSAKCIKKFGVFSEASVEKFLAVEFPKSANLWETACAELVFPNSDKVAKAIARVDKMLMPVDMKLMGMEFARFREVGDKEFKQVKAVKAGLMLQHPVHPGIGFLKPNCLEAEYVSSGRAQGFFNPGEEPLKLSDKLEAAKEVVATSIGVKAFAFNGVEVEFGEVVAWFVDADGNESPVMAEQNGLLKEIRFGEKKQASGNYYFVSLRYTNRTFTHKLRLNIKLNAVHADVDRMLADNELEFDADLLVMQDCNKWFDLKQAGIFTIIAETFTRSEKYRALILQANRLINPASTIDNVFIYSRKLRLEGAYNFLVDAFMNDFGNAVWWKSPCTKDFALLYAQMYSGMSESGKQGWREADSSILLDGNIPSHAHVYTNAPEGMSYLFDYDKVEVNGEMTRVKNVRSAVCVWVDEDSNHWIAIRGFGLIGSPEEPLYAPVLSEYTAVEQSIVDTDVLAFDMTDLALRGHHDLVKNLLSGGDEARKINVALNAVVKRGQFTQKGKELPVVEVDSETEFFTSNEREILNGYENEPLKWFETVLELKSDVVYRWGDMNLYLPVIKLMNVNMVLSAQETMVSKLYSILRMVWNGYSPADLVLGKELTRFRGMILSYLAGDNHVKGLVRGSNAVSCKVAGLPIIPTGQSVVVSGGNVHKQMVKSRIGNSRNIMMWRPPIRNAAVLSMSYLNDQLSNKTEFGRLYKLGWYELTGDRLYVGLDQNFNFGDYDGDPIKFIDVTSYVADGTLTRDNYNSMHNFLTEVVGVDMRSKEFWGQEEPVQQYFADHFYIPSYNKVMSKISLDASMFVSEEKWIEFLKGATEVQKVSVGLMYRISAMHNMLAEVMNSSDLWNIDEDWTTAFEYLKGKDGRKYSARMECIYECALGGYSKSMEALMVGYLGRAVNGQTDSDWSTLSSVKNNLVCTSNSSVITDHLKGAVEFTHVSIDKVESSLVELGFAKEDLGFMTKAALFAAFGKMLGRQKGLGRRDDISTCDYQALIVVTCICQAVLNYSQNKHMDEGKQTAYCFNTVKHLVSEDQNVKALVEHICNTSATGAIFKRLADMRKLNSLGICNVQ